MLLVKFLLFLFLFLCLYKNTGVLVELFGDNAGSYLYRNYKLANGIEERVSIFISFCFLTTFRGGKYVKLRELAP